MPYFLIQFIKIFEILSDIFLYGFNLHFVPWNLIAFIWCFIYDKLVRLILGHVILTRIWHATKKIKKHKEISRTIIYSWIWVSGHWHKSWIIENYHNFHRSNEQTVKKKTNFWKKGNIIDNSLMDFYRSTNIIWSYIPTWNNYELNAWKHDINLRLQFLH